MPATPPNIVMITCHDLGQHLGCYGVDSVNSPHIDALASQGVRFERCYATSSVCSPARGSLHTGRYPQSNGLMGLTHAPWWWRLNDDERHTAQHLQEFGYRTHLVGFNHISHDWQRLGYHQLWSERRKALETVEAARELFTAAASDDRPLFAKIGFTEVHRPFTHGSDESRGVRVPGFLQDTPTVRQDFAEYQATIRAFDNHVGHILNALSQSPLADNTLVVFTSDHGIPYPGAKWTARKAGIEVPLILYQPGTACTGGRVIPQMVSHIDVLPTLLRYVGAPVPENIQGHSFLGLLDDSTPPETPHRPFAFAQYTPDMKRDNLSRSVISDRYQLIRYFDQGRSVAYPVDVDPKRFAGHVERCPTRGARPFAQLYDLQEDPWQLHDLSGDPAHVETVAKLSDHLLSWMRSVNDPLLEGPLRTPYYDQAITDLLSQELSA